MLGERPVSESDLGMAIGTKPETIRRHLRALREHGLAVPDDADQWLRGPVSLDDVATKLGIAGAGDRQRQQHQRERDNFRAARQDYAAALDTPPERVDYETGEVVATSELRSPQGIELSAERRTSRRRSVAASTIPTTQSEESTHA
jgi:DNA-binding transcriptional ArsR family regulator